MLQYIIHTLVNISSRKKHLGSERNTVTDIFLQKWQTLSKKIKKNTKKINKNKHKNCPTFCQQEMTNNFPKIGKHFLKKSIRNTDRSLNLDQWFLKFLK